MWGNDRFRLGCATEVRERSNETWLKIDYGQLHIRIKSMWLRRVYFVLLKSARKLWHRSDRLCRDIAEHEATVRAEALLCEMQATIWSTPRNIVGGRI
jgi:hypothetical protein